MKNTFLVGIVQRRAKLPGHGKNFRQFGCARADEFLQALALDKLRSHEDRESLITTGIETSDGGVVQRAAGARFGKNPLDQFVNVVQPFGDFELTECEHSPQLRVSCLANDPYAAATQFLQDLKAIGTRGSRRASGGVFSSCLLHLGVPCKTLGRRPESYLKCLVEDAQKNNG